ncbi:hypothetical protein CLU81_2030 [Flavobacterium sp. 9]|uniref:hypothetical protein n=1 Tax=Flavobacterium sp. 9 TaxID=2035198 RepID=UPI000C1A0526|nr:hypothetical protein [Flavobacterium sp. 9]PIF31536.1 hypothetical protein CLU81_2030 [Flavobacterium sp. 9]
MKCIICDEIANEVGSHLIPASLIKNCVGAHYKEESYNIDSKNAQINVYFGRDNLKNTSTEIKPNDYKRDYILCKVCEKKLATLESKFASEFLQKFRNQKYLSNFKYYDSSLNFEIFEPQKVSNIEIQAYFYSIIFRFCCVYKIEDNDSYLEEKDLLKIKKFLNDFLYNHDTKGEYGIEEFRILINFNKYSEKSKFIATSNDIKNPYIFYFCEAIILLFTEELKNEDVRLFGDCVNSITDKSSKIIVGPEEFYDTLSKKIADILAETFMINAVNYICELNKKTFAENLLEANQLIEEYKEKNISIYIVKVFEELKKRYGGQKPF